MRNYINIIEAVLYRGDASEIEAYMLDKTDAGALFGRGIYLTDNRDVAGDYTVKGGSDSVISDRSQEYTSSRDAIAGYINDVVNKEFNWLEVSKDIKDKHSNNWWDAMRGLNRNTPEYDEMQERLQAAYKADLVAQYGKIVKEAKKLYRARSKDFRMVKNTLGSYTIVKQNRPGKISRFDIPDEYLSKTLHGDRPLSDDEIAAIGKFIESRSSHMDLRDVNYERVASKDDQHNFWEWVRIFKKTGSHYAWRDGNSRIGGKGVNPSLDEIWNGTFGGFDIFYKSGGNFIPYMQSKGYTGIEYDGGVRIGGKNRGGGGVRHQSYVLWDADYVNGCRVEQESVVDPEIDYDASKLRTMSLFSKQRS